MAIVYGTNTSELINKTHGVTDNADTIFGFGGGDIIDGLGGDDAIFSGSDNDVIRGGSGADHIDGGSGSDYAVYDDSGSGVVVSLGNGIGSGSGGTAQGDVLKQIENLRGSSHDDLLVGDGYDNVLEGGGDNDNLQGGGGYDQLFGHSGDDTLKGGVGGDTMNGGSGVDTAVYAGSSIGVSVLLNAGYGLSGDAEGDGLTSIENLIGSSYSDYVEGTNGVNVLQGMSGDDVLIGRDGEDILLGGNHNDTLAGHAHDDTLNGEGGDDTIDGGAGIDTMIGGLGNDTFIVDNADDFVLEKSLEGTDTAKVTVDYALAADVWVEMLRTTNDKSTTAIDLAGNGIANMLVGNAGANMLDGGGGKDIMTGLAGNDTYYVDHAYDAILETTDGGGDTVRASLSYQLTAGTEVEALTAVNGASTAPQTLTGNDLTQVIVGNAGISVLRGLGGNDQLQGMAGNDTLTGGAGQDKFLFNTALNAATNVDAITDFSVVDDLIRLDDAIFTKAGAVGTLAADAFHVGTAAADAEDRFIYDSTSGNLFYDTNGNAAGGSTLFAKLGVGLALTNADFAVV